MFFCQILARISDFSEIQRVCNSVADGRADNQTDGWTNGQSDGPTNVGANRRRDRRKDKPSYRDARTNLKVCSPTQNRDMKKSSRNEKKVSCYNVATKLT